MFGVLCCGSVDSREKVNNIWGLSRSETVEESEGLHGRERVYEEVLRRAVEERRASSRKDSYLIGKQYPGNYIGTRNVQRPLEVQYN